MLAARRAEEAIDALMGPDRDEGFHAIFETLAWVGVIRDRLRGEGQAIPPTLNGLYYVRNLALHQGAEVLEWMLTLSQDQDPRDGLYVWWPAKEDLPSPRSTTGAAEYEAQLAGKGLGETLEQVIVELAHSTRTGAT